LKPAFFEKILPVIWLEIKLEVILKIPSQNIGNFKNGFRFLMILRGLSPTKNMAYIRQLYFAVPTLL
jgi:hypothetical protein